MAEILQRPVLVKKSRKRFKKLFPQIRDQMEFYFSDANLQKDRFLKKKVEDSTEGYIELELFLKFNKMRPLVEDVETLARALKKSDLLQLNEEKTKVRRTTVISAPTNVDERTVYVECLPLRADHNWIKSVFAPCGRVAYVSLPRYKSTGDIKGFAFVEFDSVESAQKACKLLNNPPVSVTEKPGRFPKSKETRRLERQLEMRLGRSVRKRRASESQVDNVADKLPAKRRRTISECVDSENHVEKKTTSARSKERHSLDQKSDQMACDADEQSNTDCGVSKSSAKSRQDSQSKQRRREKQVPGDVIDGAGEEGTNSTKSDEGVSSLVEMVSSGENDVDARKAKIPCKPIVESTSCSDANLAKAKQKKTKKTKAKDIPELRVISKRDWIQLRSEYLSLQKANMAELKKSLQAFNENLAKQQRERSRVNAEATSNAAKKSNQTSSLVFSPGLIVHVSGDQPLNRKELKAKLSSAAASIAYVDLIDGNTECYVRCNDAESARSVVAATVPSITLHLLAGEEEKQYWDKALADREKKLGGSAAGPKPKRRGRDKILLQAEKAQCFVDMERKKKHIVFDD